MAAILPTDVEFQIPHDGKYLAFVRKGVSMLASGAGFSYDDCIDVEVAVGEAVTNAILHGKPADGEGKVVVRCRLTPHRLIIEVEDGGEGLCEPDVRCIPDDDDEHGRGWLLMYNLMDRASFRCSDHGLVVRLVKRRRSVRTAIRTARLDLNVA